MKYCKNCGKELKDGAKFCPKCGSPVALISDGNIKQPPGYTINIPSLSDGTHKIKSPDGNIKRTPESSTDLPSLSAKPDNIKSLQTAADKSAGNGYSPTEEANARKNTILPYLYGIIPVLIVAVIAVFLYETNRLPFIGSATPVQTSALLNNNSLNNKNNNPAEKNITGKANETSGTSPATSATTGETSLKKSETKSAKTEVTYVYPKQGVRSAVSPSYTPSKTYLPPKPVYRVNHAGIAFDTFRTNFNSAGAKLINFAPEHVSGESGISFVVLSHVRSFAPNTSPNSTEIFKVEFTAAIPQNINASKVKIISKVNGHGISAENISYVNLSSSGIYTIEIPVGIPQYFRTGSYYFNADVESPGIGLTSVNAYFRVE